MDDAKQRRCVTATLGLIALAGYFLAWAETPGDELSHAESRQAAKTGGFCLDCGMCLLQRRPPDGKGF
jgi:hypothetical protein